MNKKEAEIFVLKKFGYNKESCQIRYCGNDNDQYEYRTPIRFPYIMTNPNGFLKVSEEEYREMAPDYKEKQTFVVNNKILPKFTSYDEAMEQNIVTDKNRQNESMTNLSQDTQLGISVLEGVLKEYTFNRGSRNRKVVNERLKKDGYTCQACTFRYENDGKYIIDCHHLTPISEGITITNINSLVSLCPTCHRIAHLKSPVPYNLDEIISIRKEQLQKQEKIGAWTRHVMKALAPKREK